MKPKKSKCNQKFLINIYLRNIELVSSKWILNQIKSVQHKFHGNKRNKEVTKFVKLLYIKLEIFCTSIFIKSVIYVNNYTVINYFVI